MGGLEFENRNLNRINTALETRFYTLLNFYRTAIIKFADRRKYYDAFDEYARTSSPEAMVQLVAEAVVSRLREMIEMIK